MASDSELPITDIILWLDCDREGEAICFEVLEVLLGEKIQRKNFDFKELEDKFGLKIHRAKFSAATRADI
jgi:DNA topoisomerase IA